MRPVSGITHGDDTRDGRASSVNRGMGVGEASAEADEENFNKIANHDLILVRDRIKEDFRLAEEAARKKAAALEKEKLANRK